MAHSSYAKFDIAVRNYYGSINTAIVFDRLLYWSKRYPEGFYKFKRPCGDTNKLYKRGDSWEEELGMLRKTLDPIFNRLVQSYSSKRLYLKEGDKFKGKMFVSYRNRKTSQTFYIINQEAVDKFLESLKIKRKITTSPSIEKENDKKNHESLVMSQNRFSTVPDEHSFARAHPIDSIQTITTLDTDVSTDINHEAKKKEELSSKAMIKAWNSHMQDNTIWYASNASKLYRILNEFFAGCIERFEKYCKCVASSKFLTGRATNSRFKAFFYWIIKPQVIRSIFEGAYGVEKMMYWTQNQSDKEKLEKEYNSIGYEIINAEKKIEYAKQKIIIDQQKLIKDHQQTVDEKIKDDILKSIESKIDEPNPIMRKVLVNVQYHDALKKYSHDKLNLTNPEDVPIPPQFIDELNLLREKRINVGKRMQEINDEIQKAQMNFGTLVENYY